MPPQLHEKNPLRVLLLAAAAYFTVAAILYNPVTVNLVLRLVHSALHRPWTHRPPATAIVSGEAQYLGIAVVFFLLARMAGSSRRVPRTLSPRILLAALAFLLPAITLEIALQPYAAARKKKTSLFVRDATLGWKMRANARQPWGGTTVVTNAHGLRGPDVSYERRPGVRRILYLGDSVTFGYRMTRAADAFPFVVDSLFNARGVRLETVNGGVGGYSSWQELRFLRHVGLRYSPDTVVLAFVLNDVTEKFTMVDYGGYEEPWQLRVSYYSTMDRVLSQSALAYTVRNLTREYKGRRRLGDDARLGAIKQQALAVETLIRHPEQKNVALAWSEALADVQAIQDACAGEGIPMLLVVFPFTMQLDRPEEMASPQRVIMDYATSHGIDAIDLLPLLADKYRESGERGDTLFVDEDHLTAFGHRYVAEIICDSLRARDLP